MAAGLLAAGLEPGDRLGIWSPNNYEWVVTQFAAAKAGLVLVRENKIVIIKLTRRWLVIVFLIVNNNFDSLAEIRLGSVSFKSLPKQYNSLELCEFS